MSSSCPRQTNANLRPTAVILAAKQTQRSSAEVAEGKAALEAQHQELLLKQQEDLEKLHQLEQQIKKQARENASHATRPPPIQPTPAIKAGRVPSAATTVTAALPEVQSRAAVVVDANSEPTAPAGIVMGQPSTARKVLPGHIRRLTQADIEAHCAGGPIPAGQEPAGAGCAAKENVLPTHGATITDEN